MDRYRFEKRITTPETDGYTGVTFSLYGEAEEEDFVNHIEGPICLFDDEHPEAERYCMQEGLHKLWRYADVWDQQILTDESPWDYVYDDDKW